MIIGTRIIYGFCVIRIVECSSGGTAGSLCAVSIAAQPEVVHSQKTRWLVLLDQNMYISNCTYDAILKKIGCEAMLWVENNASAKSR